MGLLLFLCGVAVLDPFIDFIDGHLAGCEGWWRFTRFDPPAIGLPHFSVRNAAKEVGRLAVPHFRVRVHIVAKMVWSIAFPHFSVHMAAKMDGSLAFPHSSARKAAKVVGKASLLQVSMVRRFGIDTVRASLG